MMDCNTCGYSVGGFCTIHHTVPGGCQDYVEKLKMNNPPIRNIDFSCSFDITSKITDQYIEFETRAFDSAFEKCGYRREDLEKAIAELKEYRKLGTLEEVRKDVEKAEAKKPKFYATNWYCPICGNLVGNSDFEWEKDFCVKCGQKIDWSVNDEENQPHQEQR